MREYRRPSRGLSVASFILGIVTILCGMAATVRGAIGIGRSR